jgi:predicted RecA/RadA family phage recombinase
MAKATYYQRGENLDYRNTGVTKIDAGTIVVVGGRVGVISGDIPAGGVGVLHTEGCFFFDLASTAVGVSPLGTAIYVDGSQKATTAAGSNTLAGFAAAPIAIGDTRVLVKLNATGPVGPAAQEAANQAASTASTVEGLKTDFNALLAKLKAAALMAADV